MARRRTTFGKLERDREKQARAKAKMERRAQRAETSSEESDGSPPSTPVLDDGAALAALAQLQEAFGAGKLSLEDFEAQRERLRQSLGLD